MIDLTELTPTMQRAWLRFHGIFPEVEAISGKRTVLAQARAMASNTLQDRQFCGKTYPKTPELQRAIDALRGPLTMVSASTALTDVLLGLSLDRLTLFPHIAGRAVDVNHSLLEDDQGIKTTLGHAVLEWIRRQPETDWVTPREAGLIRWHWQVRAEDGPMRPDGAA